MKHLNNHISTTFLSYFTCRESRIIPELFTTDNDDENDDEDDDDDVHRYD